MRNHISHWCHSINTDGRYSAPSRCELLSQCWGNNAQLRRGRIRPGKPWFKVWPTWTITHLYEDERSALGDHPPQRSITGLVQPSSRVLSNSMGRLRSNKYITRTGHAARSSPLTSERSGLGRIDDSVGLHGAVISIIPGGPPHSYLLLEVGQPYTRPESEYLVGGVVPGGCWATVDPCLYSPQATQQLGSVTTGSASVVPLQRSVSLHGIHTATTKVTSRVSERTCTHLQVPLLSRPGDSAAGPRKQFLFTVSLFPSTSGLTRSRPPSVVSHVRDAHDRSVDCPS